MVDHVEHEKHKREVDDITENIKAAIGKVPQENNKEITFNIVGID